MKPKKYKVRLSAEERTELITLTKKGKHSSAIVKRANILLALDETAGKPRTQAEIAEQLSTTTTTIYKVSKQYCEEGLQATLERKLRETPPRPCKATGEVEARIIALACSAPPKGRSRWTLRLLEEKVVEMEIIDSISE